jgi:hypothetical protein
MFYRKNKVQLSPKMKLGVGRAYSQSQLFKYSGILFLLLSIGLVFNAVRLLYKEGKTTNIATTQSSPQVLGVNDQVQFVEYKVVAGDTLFNIAQKYNLDWTTLATINNLTPPLKLKIGQILKVPKQ